MSECLSQCQQLFMLIGRYAAIGLIRTIGSTKHYTRWRSLTVQPTRTDKRLCIISLISLVVGTSDFGGTGSALAVCAKERCWRPTMKGIDTYSSIPVEQRVEVKTRETAALWSCYKIASWLVSSWPKQFLGGFFVSPGTWSDTHDSSANFNDDMDSIIRTISTAKQWPVSRNRLSPRTSVDLSETILYFYSHLSPTS